MNKIKYIIKDPKGKIYVGGLTPVNMKFAKEGRYFNSLDSLQSTLSNIILESERSRYVNDMKGLREEIKTWRIFKVEMIETEVEL